MKLTRNALALGFAVAAVSAAACSSQHGSAVGTTNGGGSQGALVEGAGNTGSVGMHLFIPNSNFTIDSLNWTITNGTSTYTGTINMTDDAGNAAQSIEFVAGPVLAGSGYTATLSGSDSNGDPCTGTSPAFTVMAGTSMTASASVNVICNVATDAALSTTVDSGSVYVEAGVTINDQQPFQCPGITGVSISPAELKPPETAALGAGVAAGTGGAQTLLWSATCGTGTPIITNPTTAAATFSCGTAVNTTCNLTLTVGLDGTAADGGTVGQVCTGLANTTISETVECEPGTTTLPNCPTGQTQCGTTAPDCVNEQTDPLNCGGCNVACGATTPNCIAGACVAAPPTACITAPCAATGPNSVQCPNTTNNGVCTATEASIVAKDIAAGFLTGGQLSPFSATTSIATQGSCYACLNFKSCLDDNNGDTGNECADAPDLTGQGGGTAGTPGQGPTLCQTVLDCVLNNDCQGPGGIANTTANASQENTNLCYCGGNNAGSVCSASTTTQNGLCVGQEAAASGFAQSDSKDILADFGSNLYPYGIANHIFQCASAQKCSICATE